MAMTSNRPYLIRAFYDWIVDNDCTPYIVVDAYFRGVEVPQQYVNDGQIVLNLAPRAVVGLEISNRMIRFNTRFGGVSTDISLPVEAVLGIYARENGQGMVFQPEATQPTLAEVEHNEDGDDIPPPSGDKPGGRPNLRVIK